MSAKRKKLGDLYVRGAELRIDDEEAGIYELVWIQKPNPVQHENMLRIANAARSKVTMQHKDRNSEGYLAALDEVSDMFPTRDAMEAYLVQLELSEVSPKVEAELSMDPEGEWAKDGYLQGLRDAWSNGLSDAYARRSEEDPVEEADQVFAELKRFANEVEAVLEGHRREKRSDFSGMSDERVTDLVVKKHLNHKGTQAWFAAYRRAQVRYAVRDHEDHGKYYFEKLEDVEALDINVLRLLFEKLEEISVDPQEGKD
jgi:hypothetical protein